ncbi:MAG: 50S ribosomal protein L21 [Anaerolineales bacterium]|jgi:large subunit ribosomal protein L21
MKYAIVQSGGKQYRAVEGATIEVDRLSVELGASLKLEEVLLVADGGKIEVGAPYVKGAVVSTSVLEHVRAPKVRVFKYKPKMRYRVHQGHRQNYTRLRIEEITRGAARKATKKTAEA